MPRIKYTGVGLCFVSYRTKKMYVLVYELYEGLCYVFPVPRIEVLSFWISAASATLQFTISRNERQSLSDNENVPEEVLVGLLVSCTRTALMGDGRMCALAGCHWRNGLVGTSCGCRRPRMHERRGTKHSRVRSLTAASYDSSLLRLLWSRT